MKAHHKSAKGLYPFSFLSLWKERNLLLKVVLLSVLSLLFVADCVAQESYPGIYTPGFLRPADTVGILAIIRQGEGLSASAPDSAVILLRKALAESEQALYPAGIRKGLQVLLPLLDEAQKEIVLQHYLKLCELNKSLEPAIVVVYNALGKLRQLQDRYEDAGRYYMLSIPVAARYMPDYLATVYNNYGSLFSALPDSLMSYERSMYYLDKAEQIARKTNDLRIMTCVLCNKAKLYRNQKRYTESMDLLLQSLALAQQNHFHQWEMVALNNIGDLHFVMGHPEKAIPYLLKSLKMEGAGVAPYYRNMAVFTLGEVYASMGQKEKAAHYFSLSLAMAKEYGITRDLIEANKRLALINADKGDYASAFGHLLTYSRLNDSIRSSEIVHNVQQLEVKYRTSEKDRELLKNKLHMQHQEKSLSRKNTIIELSVALVLVLILIFMFVYNRFRQRQKLLKQEEQIREMKALIKGEEQERIRLAQELHDGIGGMLAAVNMNLQVAMRTDFKQKQELLDIMRMIEATTEEVRKTSHNLMPSALLRENLKEALQHYCDICHNGDLRIDLSTHGTLDTLNQIYITMIFRIVQELIQNVIRHAAASHVIVSLEREGDQICLMVEDNGKGFDSTKIPYGFGLENLSFRVKTLGGNLDIQSEPSVGTSITVSFIGKDITG